MLNLSFRGFAHDFETVCWTRFPQQICLPLCACIVLHKGYHSWSDKKLTISMKQTTAFHFLFLQSKFVKTVVNQHWDSGKARLKIFTSVGATPHRRQWEMWPINIYMGQKLRQLETIWAGITATELSLKFSIQCFVHSLGPGEEQRSSDKEIFFRFVLSLVTQEFYFLNKMNVMNAVKQPRFFNIF